MSKDIIQEMPDARSFEERVFARFDAIDARLDGVEARLQKLEEKAYDTKPIWERALAELMIVSQKVDSIERKLNVMNRDMLALRADQDRLEDRLDKLELKPAR